MGVIFFSDKFTLKIGWEIFFQGGKNNNLPQQS